MESFRITVFFILLALNIAIYLLSKTKYRNEDAARIADGSLKALCLTKGAWVFWILMLIPLFGVSTFTFRIVRRVILLVAVVAITFLGFIYVLFRHNSYYTIDKERLSYIRHGKLKWSYRWDEIDYAQSNVISEKEESPYYYDIITKDGVKRRFLSVMLKEYLVQHVKIHKHVWEWPFYLSLIPFIAMIILIISRLLED